jgi:predicted phosphodiesterase
MIIKKGQFEAPFSREYVAKVALLADTHIGYDSWGDYSALTDLINNINKQNVDMCFILGDCIDSGYKNTPDLMTEQLNILDNHFKMLKVPLFKLKGNHCADVPHFTEFGVVTINDVRFICIFPKYVGTYAPEGANQEYFSKGLLTLEDVEWIDTALADGEGYKNVILSHYALEKYENNSSFKWGICDITKNIYYNDVEVDGHRDELVAVLNKYDIDLWLNGHEHTAGLINTVVKDTNNITDVHIGSSSGGAYVILTIYNDRYELKEYNKNNEITATLTVNA